MAPPPPRATRRSRGRASSFPNRPLAQGHTRRVPNIFTMGRTVVSILAGVALAVGAVLIIRGSADDEPASSKQVLADAERQTTGAYGCMPPGVRRKFDRAVKQYDVRFGEVLDQVPDDAEPAAADSALRSDREFNELRNKARGILLSFLPRGSEYDKACFDRAVRRYDRRVARRK